MKEVKMFCKKVRDLMGCPVYMALLMILIVIIMQQHRTAARIIGVTVMFLGLTAVLAANILMRTNPRCRIRRIVTSGVLLVSCVIWMMYVTHTETVMQHLLSETANAEEVLGYVADYPQHKVSGSRHKTTFRFRVVGVRRLGITDYIRVRPFDVAAECPWMTDESNGECLYLKGDRMIIRQSVTLPECGTKFDYAAYLRYNGIVGQIRANIGDIVVIDDRLTPLCEMCRPIRHSFYNMRQNVIHRFRHAMSDKGFGFFVSVFLGIRSELDADTAANFRDSGMTHLIAISGMHISVIGGFIFALFSLFLSKSKSYILSLIVLWLYICLLSFQPSSARAFIMYGIVTGFFAFGHSAGRLTGIAVSAIVLMIINPLCIFLIGFQFSYLATIGIVLFNDEIGHHLRLLMPGRIFALIRDNMSVTLSAFVSVAFVQVGIFSQIAVFSLVSSLLLIPIFELVFGILFFGSIIYIITDMNVIAVIMDFACRVFLRCIDIAAVVPAVRIPNVPTFLGYMSIPIAYTVIFCIIPMVCGRVRQAHISRM